MGLAGRVKTGSRLPTLWLAAGLLIGLSACCGRPVPPPNDAVTDPVTLLDAMRARLDGLHSARFRVVIEYYDGEVRGANFRSAVLVRQPEDLHVQILSPFGDPLRTLVSNGETLSLYDLEEQTFYTGTPSPANIARILPFYMTAADIAAVMLGGPPFDQMSADPSEYALEWDGERGSYRLSVPLATEPGRLDLWVRHGDWTVEAAKRYRADGSELFELRTGDFAGAGDTVLPTRLRFLMDLDDRDVDMSIDVESTDLNVDLPDALFELEAPAGVRQVSLD